MKIRAAIFFLTISAFAFQAEAQNVVSPPVTSFNPDTTLPKMNVPEFVVTGKAQIELPMAAKPSVEIDSSYFQGKRIPNLGIELPAERSLSSQEKNTGNESPGLFARASIGHYTTTDYLLSGSGDVGGYLVDGSIAGDYTSGFIANTISRDFSIHGGASRSYGFDGPVKATNYLELGYSRSSYFLYGQMPSPPLLRKTDEAAVRLVSDMEFGDVPVAVRIGLNRFSVNDLWNSVQSLLRLGAGARFFLGSGSVGLEGNFCFGTHSQQPNNLINILPVPATALNRSLYDLSVGAAYSNGAGPLKYSLGLTYYQYRDDSSSGIAKLYPELSVDYRVTGIFSLFGRFSGNIRESDLSGFLSTDRFLGAPIILRNTQNYADITLGGRIGVLSSLTIIPEFGYEASKYYPMFVSYPLNNSQLIYAERAAIFSASVTASYRTEYFNTDATLRFQRGQTDLLTSIPNLAPLDLNLSAGYKLTPDIEAKGWFLFLSSRHSDPSLATRLDPVGLLNFRLSYHTRIATLPFTFFIDGKNLFNQRYFIWQGYQEFPLTLSVGLSSKIL
ncbi:MAG: hypothetical protein M1469_11735 [Bacteroidetes bacterium]|nr:hypothetical protein [Bacteroidota bacterium]